MTASTAKQPPSPVTESPEWQALKTAQARISKRHIATLFEEDPQRFENYSLTVAGILFDYSKHLLGNEARNLLFKLADRACVPQAITAMFRGDLINNTEQRPALHVSLRSPRQDSPEEKAVQHCLQMMGSFTAQVHNGEWRGFDGSRISDIVNIGIGGSDLGPAMVYEALRPFRQSGLRCHFVSNVDPCHLEQTLSGLQPGSTLFIVSSKSFTTLETSLNAAAAKHWLLQHTQDERALGRHFVAVTANMEKARAFGIRAENIFPMWDWVGGRYSLWSAIGITLALGLGMNNFRALLHGAHKMDEHFRDSPMTENMPVIMALLAIWYLDFFNAQSQVVLPYSQNLQLFPAFLQQLDMESLGKSVRKNGEPHEVPTGGIIWGSAGSNGQHSFHQLLHQGTHLIPADFIAVAGSSSENREAHEQLLANCLAQSQALMLGKTLDTSRDELKDSGLNEEECERLAAHRSIPGNRPSSSFMLDRLDPQTLGALIAAYEHKVYVQSVILQINAFDQWGVELGKVLGKNMLTALQGKRAAPDPSSAGLINRYRKLTGKQTEEAPGGD